MVSGSKIPQRDEERLKSYLGTLYMIVTYWNGKLHVGIKLDWKYIDIKVELFMPGYVQNYLHQYQHTIPLLSQYPSHTVYKRLD